MLRTSNPDGRNVRPRLQEFNRDRSGAVAVLLALTAPVLVAFVGLALDYGFATSQRSTMQAAADAAALAGAKELSLSDAKRENVEAVVKAVVATYVQENGTSLQADPSVDTQISNEPLRVTVKLRTTYTPLIGGHLGMSDTDISVQAVARVAGQPNICVLALEPRELGAVALSNNATLTGKNCAVFSNSRSSSGLTVSDGAHLSAATVCSAGGIMGNGQITPPPYQDCPQFTDPLSGRPEPNSQGCDYIATIILNQDRVLKPGVYCLGLTITGFSRVTFLPGIYVIKNGPFLVAVSSEIKGEGVGFFLQGLSFFTFDPMTKIELTAPKDGPMAGLLFFGSRSQSKLLLNTILSSNAQVMLGTIYLPTTTLVVDALAKVGSKSAYTAIVARRLTLLDGPELVLNSDYGATNVPVPKGIRGSGQPAQLIK